jgi:16S rRNA (cytosine1402-N4)-methyltransferase
VESWIVGRSEVEEHQPVLLEEVTRWLRPERGGSFVDCTVGLGGHSEAILAASTAATVIGIDRDAETLKLAAERLKGFGERFRGIHVNFKDLDTALADAGAGNQIDGCLADLGVSSLQLGSAERGFSFQHDAPLDMRMDRSKGTTAADLINQMDERELADLIFKYGEEPGSRRIARAIVRERPVTTTTQLAQIIVRALKRQGHWRVHPATRTFQALRIAVNDELDGLDQFITTAVSHLCIGGLLAIISFHSLEDRIVKNTFKLESGVCQCPPRLRRATQEQQSAADEEGHDPSTVCRHCGARKRAEILTRKAVQPGQDEIQRNPRARSARLRVCERIQ